MTFNPIIPISIMVIICIPMLLMKRKGIWNYIRQVLIVLLIFAINLRPMVPTDKVVVLSSNIDILFVVDNTISMLAEDYGPSDERRIDAVKEHVNSIMESFDGARFALITFDDDTRVLVPYTYETRVIEQAVGALDGMSSEYAVGTSLNDSYDAMRTVLRATEKQETDEDITETTSDRIQVVFYISDGEITNNENLRNFAPIADYVDAGAVLGYGTTAGGHMRARVAPLDNEYEYVQYYDNNYNLVRAVSKIDEDNLEDIAEDLGIQYSHITKASDITSILRDVHEEIEAEEYVKAEQSGEGFLECYFILAIALGALVIYDYVYYRSKMSKEG